MKALKWLDEHFEEIFLVIFLVLITCVSLIQVIFKKGRVLAPLTWTDECCRYMWSGTVFMSLPYTIRKGSMLRVSVLLDTLPTMVRKVINIAVDLVTAACMGLLPVPSIQVVGDNLASSETSTAMAWTLWTV